MGKTVDTGAVPSAAGDIGAQRETAADDYEFTLILSGNDVSISGKGIDDTFGIDIRTVIDIVLNVPDWSYMFEFDTILIEES